MALGDIGKMYNKKIFSLEEQTCIKRVLGKDAPHTFELAKFANAWVKRHPEAADRLFAVDGTLGDHPKQYLNEAVFPDIVGHTETVRKLYELGLSRQRICEIVTRAFESTASDDLRDEVKLYVETAGLEQVKKVAEIRNKSQALKRKRLHQSSEEDN